MEIDKVYEPQRFEPRWAEWWVSQKLFRAEITSGPCFSLVIPPPNITGALHIGHMFDHTLIDTAVRWNRMRGLNALYLPGTDHAGIGTQMVVERELAKEGISRKDIGREEFERRVWEWKEKYGSRIVEQMKSIGASCDWTRERFTLDPGLSRAVREAFVRLWEKGLIYRGAYMVNWCPRCQTAISDLETVHTETDSFLWYIRYPVIGSDANVVVATTRPETMLGDTAVAMHPEDPRAHDLHEKSVQLPLMNRPIPVILDAFVDPKFGTGIVKITPAHDANDFEAAKRHDLPHVKVIGEDGRMTAEAGPYAGLDRFDARERVVEDLRRLGLLEKIEPYKLSVGTCQRCKTVVEPLVSTQWWVKIKPLAEPAIEAVEDGRITFIPANWTNTYFQWMRNIRDWCISRQLWWGHRIPAWHCKACGHITVSREDPSKCEKCGSANLEQETDVLDTWFSSGLWPFSTLGWPDDTADLRTFYPTTLLVTGFDIIFFWVARMIMFGMEMMRDVPFRQVHIHGLVRDAEGVKMSKTRGNVIDPLDINARFGTDAVRFTLLISAAPGGDIALGEDRLGATRSFANKIWNASRLIFSRVDVTAVAEPPRSLEDRWIASRLNATTDFVNRSLAQHRYHEAADAVWHFIWDELCDWYLELKKLHWDQNPGHVIDVYETALRLLHPMMPFITEELWHRLSRPGKSIALLEYPRFDPARSDAEAESEMKLMQEIITAARAIRADHKIDNKQVLSGSLYCRNGIDIAAIQKLANIDLELHRIEAPKLEGAVRSTPEFALALRVAATGAMRDRILREIDQLGKLIANLDRQLSNESFLAKAPEKVVADMRAKKADYEAQLAKKRADLDAA
jgi:valyl-tRNA synthetase